MKARQRPDHLTGRLPWLKVAFGLAMVTIVGWYWFVQLVDGAYYRELAENNRLRRAEIRAPRGLVLDRTGRLLVENVPSYNLLLDRERAADPLASLEFAAGVLDRPPTELEAMLAAPGVGARLAPLLIAEDLSLAEVARIEASALEHPEFEVDVGHLRLYRYGSQTAHVLGHLGEAAEDELAEGGPRPGDLVGKRGVEESYDALLRGQDGERVVIVDSRGKVQEEYGRVPARPGRSIGLTLELELQQEAARYFEGRVGAAVALDPASGAVRLMYSSPAYEPNLFARRLARSDWEALISDPHHPLQNRAIQNVYSPGSVFKIVMGVAGLAEGAVRAGDSVYCGGSTRIYGRRFRCWKRSGHGRVALHEAVKESCDVYFYHLGQELGIERIAHYARLFDLGRPTGVDIGGEKAGLVPDPEWSLRARRHPWYPGETISVAIGQGPILVSPLQVASLMAIVANGGHRVTPHVAEVGQPAPPVDLELPAAPLAAVREALEAVVADGTGRAGRVPGLTMGGKTGTVQVVRQETWIDAADLPFEQRDHAWFASWASDGERSLATAVFVEHGGRGSAAAAPLARRIYEVYFRDSLGEPSAP